MSTIRVEKKARVDILAPSKAPHVLSEAQELLPEFLEKEKIIYRFKL